MLKASKKADKVYASLADAMADSSWLAPLTPDISVINVLSLVGSALLVPFALVMFLIFRRQRRILARLALLTLPPRSSANIFHTSLPVIIIYILYLSYITIIIDDNIYLIRLVL